MLASIRSKYFCLIKTAPYNLRQAKFKQHPVNSYFQPGLAPQNFQLMMNAITFRANPEIAEPQASVRAIAIKTGPIQQKSSASGKVVLPTMEGLCFEKVKHIAYLEANGNYTAIHFKDKRQVLVCKTLREVEQMLPGTAFSRIHRSHTIHLRHIKKYVRGKGGYVVLQNGVTLSVSAGQKEYFLESLRQFFGQS